MVDGAVMNCAYKRTHFRPGDKTKTKETKNSKKKKRKKRKGEFCRLGNRFIIDPAADREPFEPLQCNCAHPYRMKKRNGPIRSGNVRDHALLCLQSAQRVPVIIF